MRKYIIPSFLIAVLLIILAGCGDSGPVLGTNMISTRDVRLSDGREVACVIYGGYNVVCDFDHPVSNIEYPMEDK